MTGAASPTPSKILDQERKAWDKSFGGGMIEFDAVWFGMKREQHTRTEYLTGGDPYEVITPGDSEISKAAASALLDAFVERLKVRFEKETR